MNPLSVSAPTSEGWDIVIVGGGLAGAFAAGELGLRGLGVLLLEPSHALGGECTRSKCPSSPLMESPGEFADEIRKQAAQISEDRSDLSRSFLLELSLEQALLHTGAKILYGALPRNVARDNNRKTTTVHAAVKAGIVPCEASQGILLRRHHPESDSLWALHAVLLVGAENHSEVTGEFEIATTRLRYRIPAASPDSHTRLWLSWEVPSSDGWEIEKILASAIPSLLPVLRENEPALRKIEVIYIADEPLILSNGKHTGSWTWMSANPALMEELQAPSFPTSPPPDPLLLPDHLAAQLAEEGCWVAETLLTATTLRGV